MSVTMVGNKGAELTTLKGTLKFQVKWEGYNDKKDLTWEPEDNLS